MDKKTGLMHDDDGHVDDKRVASWVCLAAAIGLSTLAIFQGEAPVEIIQAFLLASVGLMAPSVAEKFKRPGGSI